MAEPLRPLVSYFEYKTLLSGHQPFDLANRLEPQANVNSKLYTYL